MYDYLQTMASCWPGFGGPSFAYRTFDKPQTNQTATRCVAQQGKKVAKVELEVYLKQVLHVLCRAEVLEVPGVPVCYHVQHFPQSCGLIKHPRKAPIQLIAHKTAGT